MAFNNCMHERNIYKNRPDFAQIARNFPSFRKYAIPDSKGKIRVDFSNTNALRMLTEILLKKDFNLTVEIPQGFLIPTVPQRLNYILWVEDLLADNVCKSKNIIGIDIGTGPCAIFSLLAAQKNGWNFIATETSEEAVCWALKNIEKNNLADKINVVKVSSDTILSDILATNEICYDFCLCNPPFFENVEEIRKKHPSSEKTIADVAQKEEVFVKGGEVEFVKKILKESIVYKDRVCLFTSMFGKKKSFLQILKEIKDIEDAKMTTAEFCQGNTVRWGIAWTFNQSVTFREVKKKEKPKKVKPALEYVLPVEPFKSFDLRKLLKNAETILQDLEIPFTKTKISRNFAELLLKSDKNTWVHQRRKRRELKRQQNATTANTNSSTVELISSETDSVLKNNFEPINDILCNNNNSDSSKIEMTEHGDASSEPVIPTDYNSSTSHKSDISKIPKNISNSKIDISNCKESNNTILQSDELHSMLIDVKLEVSPEHCSLDAKSDSVSIEDEKDISNEMEVNDYNTEEFIESENTKHISDVPKSSHNKRKNESNEEFSPESKKIKIDTDVKTNIADQGMVLHCYLQLINGKKKIYVKMNCPETADRNAMYQVFQLIKNKLK